MSKFGLIVSEHTYNRTIVQYSNKQSSCYQCSVHAIQMACNGVKFMVVQSILFFSLSASAIDFFFNFVDQIKIDEQIDACIAHRHTLSMPFLNTSFNSFESMTYYYFSVSLFLRNFSFSMLIFLSFHLHFSQTTLKADRIFELHNLRRRNFTIHFQSKLFHRTQPDLMQSIVIDCAYFQAILRHYSFQNSTLIRTLQPTIVHFMYEQRQNEPFAPANHTQYVFTLRLKKRYGNG